MNKLFQISRWGLFLLAVTGLVFIYSCGEDDPEPVDAPSITYAPATVAVGTSDDIPAASNGDPATAFAFKSPTDVPLFVSISSTTGVITVAAESTTGAYDVVVVATNEGGSTEATASITISVNASGFDPTGKSLLWRYFMNKTAGVVLENLNTLPGQGDLPAAIPIPNEWPGGNDFVIDPTTAGIEAFFTFTVVQGFLLQVPGDDVCAALSPAEKGDTLLVIVNPDLTLSTTCRNDDGSTGSTVELGPSVISYDGSNYIWTINLSLQGNPIPYAITIIDEADFTEYDFATGAPRTFPSIQGTVAAFTTPTDFEDYLGSLAFLEVDVVFEILN